jgi:hypothetical protein
MRKYVYLSMFFFISYYNTIPAQPGSGGVFDAGNAQQFMSDANGRPLLMHTDYEIEGTPFYSNDYCTANLKVRNGKKYKGIKVKINLQENLVIFDLGDGKEIEATTPVEKIEFFNCNDPEKNKILVSGFPAIDKQDESSFYVLLDSGKVTLLKCISVNYHDTKYYGKANTTRIFDQKEYYYAYVPGKGMNKLAKDNEAVLALLNNKRSEVSRFMAANEIRCRREDDMIRVFAFYNSLN